MRIDYDKRGNLDDVVIEDVEMFRLEYMNDKNIWIKCYRKDGDDIVIRLGSEKKIEGLHEVESKG